MNHTLYSFLIILLFAYLFSQLSSRLPILRIPVTVSYLIFGIILQTQWIPLSEDDVQWLNHLADFGLLFLMYISGMEVDMRLLQFPSKVDNQKNNPMLLGILIYCSTLLLSYLLCLSMVQWFHMNANPYFLCLLFSTTSLGIILPILEESELIHTDFGQSILMSALLSDFLTMVILSLYLGRLSGDGAFSTLMTLAILPMTLVMYLILRVIQRLSYIRKYAGDAKNRLRAILAILALLCIIATATGAEPILASFLVGMLVSALPSRDKDKIRDYSHGIGYGFLIPIFFLSVGLDFDLDTFHSSSALLFLPILLFLAFSSKIIPALWLVKPYGWRNMIAGGSLLCARLSLIAAAAQIGVTVHQLTHAVADSIVLVAAITALISPVIFVSTMQNRIESKV
ncbi:cation:proton antiporter [Alicyclobacillus tolerans]|uniref:Trk system potassium uptake protein TrkA n=1 Tax=Alicyclobacillus tolerans TaxID=90970 RepID=A0A1M6K827_9BACL|nr:cation:proton antiporter [Alicyclobacillus montanus]SHJ55119.1 trk system potassium uptake protein TrkA [Alicyclobacillus montanus]